MQRFAPPTSARPLQRTQEKVFCSSCIVISTPSLPRNDPLHTQRAITPDGINPVRRLLQHVRRAANFMAFDAHIELLQTVLKKPKYLE